jgi:amino acid adenylation domain-containing protein/non-ribosomal peptide synthase protein (TIGR01720 family)
MKLDAAPLSYAQQRLWLQVSLNPDDPAYHAYVALRACGDLDRHALQQSLDTIIDRHEVLRTTFRKAQNGETLQIINPQMPVSFRAAGRISADELEGEMRRELCRPFDLARGSLLRAIIYDLDDRNAMVLLTVHHLVMDGWSMGVFLRELIACYRAFVSGAAPALPPLEFQYADFVDWERERLKEVEQGELEYWREQLRPPLTATEVLPDHPRPPVPDTHGATEYFRLDLRPDARRLADSRGATLFMVLLATFEIVLQRHTLADEVVVGSPVAGRNHADIEPLIGFFVNTMVLRTDFSGAPTFAEVLARVRETTLGAWDNQDIPFDRLVNVLKPERRPGRRQFFDVMFALQNAPLPDGDLPGLTLEAVSVLTDSAKFDMTVICQEMHDALDLQIEYNTGLYDAATVRRLAASFEQVLRAACANPDARIATMPVVPPAELDELLHARRRRVEHAPAASTLHEWFALTAARYPDRIAVSWHGEELSYRALAERAERLAGRLQAAGVRPRDRVAVAMARSTDLVVGILGILKAGAAYVPLDPTYPTSRLAFMLADSSVSAVVTHGAATASLSNVLTTAGPGLPVIRIEEIGEAGLQAPASVAVAPTDAAYVIYTSGSTGKPKGVVVTHENVAGLFSATAATFGFDVNDVWTLFHSHAFDFSVWEMWGALLHGGRAVVVSHEVSRSPEALRELLDREGVTFLNQTPSAFAQLDALDARVPSVGSRGGNLALRHIVFGGEALDLASLSGWFERHGDERPALTNMYGITETTVHVTHRRIRATDARPGTPSRIGRAIDDLSLLVLDEHSQPVPVGTPGELFVGGRGVARGYLGRPGLTAERFVPDPFGADRLYRTGDRVRWALDGGLEFLGRLDTQVKVRGFRIELGEIEHVLSGAGLRESVVVPRDHDGTMRLVAYGVAASPGACSPATLREACAKVLPDYMVPAAYVLVDTLPLTRNGKLDVAALPAPDLGHDTAREKFVAPRTEIEKSIAAIWENMLGVDRVGLHDNFFALGGDSIMMLQMAARISRAGFTVGRRDLIECQTVGDLAGRASRSPRRDAREKRRITGVTIDASASPADVVEAAGAALEDEYALTPLQEGLLFHGLYAPEDGHYIEQLHARLDGDLDVRAFGRAWQTVIDGHAVFRTSFHWRGVERPVQRVARRVKFTVEINDWREFAPSEQETRLVDALARDRVRGFDLENAPLTRVTLLRLGRGRWQWIWTHHHLVLDGWSLTLIIGEVLAAYDAYQRGTEPVLPVRRPYRDFIDWLATQDHQAAHDFWRERLAGFDAPNRLEALDELSSGIAEAGSRADGPGERDLVFAPEETAALQDWARAQHVTLNTIVSACWARLLALHSGSEDVVFGVTVSGRPAELDGFEDMVGLFINTLPMRVRLRPELSLGDWLRDLQMQQAAMRDHEHVRLVDIQHESEVRAGENLFDTLLVFENYPVNPDNLKLPAGLALGPVTFVERTNFPLAVAAIPGKSLTLRVYHDRAKFGDTVVERLLRELGVLVRTMIAAAASARPLLVGDWRVVTAEEERELVQTFGEVSGTAPEPAASWRSVPARVYAEARRRPDAIAVRQGADTLSYAELDRRAALLAARLVETGVGAETIVGLYLSRDLDFIIAILAVWGAGGAYLPLDSAHPPARIALMLDDADPLVVIARPGTCLAGRKVLELDGEWWRAPVPGERPQAKLLPDQLAYVIYTSGSTGRPKGTLLTHAGLSNLAVAQGRGFDVTADSRVLQFASSSFDASVSEVAVTLCAGACLELAATDDLLHGPVLERLLRERGVTHVTLPPSVLATLPEATLPELRVLIVAGEVCAPFVAEQWAKDRRFVNAYGPTEVTVCATLGDQRNVAGRARLDIGRPLSGARVRVLDAAGRLIPSSVVGELHVGGAGVGRGYLRQPALTAERYCPDAHGSEAGARVYATGDLALWRDDGRLEFLGRADRQIKLHGHRIERGEIEHVLREHAAGRDAIVQAHVDADGTTRLVAYVLAGADGQGPTPAALRAACVNRLPDYMVPAAYVSLPEWPRTPSGKVDLRALPDPDFDRDTVRRAYTAPRSDVAMSLARIWGEVLGIARVGDEDDFFALGGDSILSLQIVSRALAAGMRISPRDLFEHPTVRGLAALVGAARVDDTITEAATGDVPLTPIQRWFFARGLRHCDRWNQAVMLEIDPRVTPDMLQRALRAVAAEHDALRLRYVRTDGITQRLAGRDTSADPMPCLVAAAPKDDPPSTPAAMERWISRLADEAHSGLDLAHGPLARAVIFLSPADGVPSRLLMVAHHLIIDGVSWRILIEGVQQRLTEQLDGAVAEPLGRSVSFAIWARRLSAYAATASLPVDYWLALSAHGAPPLPVDREAPAAANTAASLGTIDIVLDAATTAALLRQVPSVYHTRAHEPLLAACAVALAEWTGSRRVLLDLEGHGREALPGLDLDLSRTLGWFTSIYPASLELPADADPGVTLCAVKEQLRQIPSSGMPFGVTVAFSSDEDLRRRLAQVPQPQITFNYLGQLDQASDDGALLRLSNLPSGSGQHADERRTHVLDIVAAVRRGELEISFQFSTALHDRDTIARLAGDFERNLRALIDHCLRRGVGGHTPSDFPLSRIGAGSLAALEQACGPIEDLYALSPMQQGLFFHALAAPGRDLYLQQLHGELRGALDVGAFERAWRETVRRHAIFRGRFVWEGLAEPLFLVQLAAELEVTVQDWRALNPVEQDERIADLLRTDRRRGLTLDRAPLMRITLVQRGDQVWHWLWTHHHVLLDGWCVGLVLREVLDQYEARRSGTTAEPAYRRPYRDYIAWLQRQDRSRADAFWRDELADFTTPTRLTLPAAPAAAAMDDAAAAGEAGLSLSAAATARVEAWARANRLTLNTVLTGAWARLLASYSHSDDIVFGVTVAGRPAELEGADRMIGLFINTLPQRVRIRPGLPVVDWMRALQEQQLALRELDYCRLVDIQRASGLEPGVPLFETLIAFDNYPVDEALAQGFRDIEVIATRGVERTHYPLTLSVVPGRQLRMRSLFDRRRMSDAEVERILESLRHMLETVCSGQVSTVDAWSLVPPSALAPLTEVPTIARDDNLPMRFAWAAAAYPDRVAVSCGSETLTYRELSERASRLAHHLRQAEVRAESLVGLYLDRNMDVVVGILGILQAGAAYVPIDPRAPAERVRYMIADASLDLIVTESAMLAALEPAARGQVSFVVLDRDATQFAKYPRSPPSLGIPAATAAYVIYTSGSTGRPKGCVVTHANVLRLFDSTRRTFVPAADDVWTLFHSVGFDFSVWEIWGALLHGGRLVIVPHDVSRSPERLHDMLQRERVTVLNQTPSAFRQLVAVDLARQRGEEPAPLSLRHIIFGGEALQLEEVRNWIERRGEARPCLTNMYGITETTVHVTERRIRLVDVVRASGSVIGEAIPDLSLSVLDPFGLPLPPGVPGELHVAGAGVARGYLRRAGLTAERFLPGAGGERRYRSGDLARHTGEDIEYLGRIDQQVKVRGFRIELGEIEAALLDSPAVAMTTVQAVADAGDAQQRLAAYVVPSRQTSIEELREHLARKLPDYMIPAFFVLLDDLPLTVNGKVNRHALPSPDHAQRAPAAAFVAPRNDVERLLAEAFATGLGLDRVGIHDNFFALGGDSIRSIEVLSRARAAGVDLDFGSLFSHPTVAQLAAVGSEARLLDRQTEPFELVAPEVADALPRGAEAAYPLTRLQQGMLLETLDAGATSTYHDVVSYHLQAPWNREALEQALAVVAARHDILRTSILLDAGPEPLQVVHGEVTIPLRVDDLAALAVDEQEQRIDTWAREETVRAFDLDRAPLLRVQVHLRSASTFQFSLSFHHAILDGWSVATLLSELFPAYAHRLGHPVPPLPAPPAVAFRDYVALERRVLADPDERSFWEDYVAGASPTLLPRPPGASRAVQRRRVRSFEIPVPTETSQRLEQLASEMAVPLRSVLLAAHVRALGVICGESDIVTGLVTNGRPEQQDGERVLGLFLGTLPFRLRLTTGSWRELVAQVHDVEKQIERHRRFPLVEIQRLAGQALFETDFNFVHFHVLEQALRVHDELQVLGARGFEETGFTLAVNFGLGVGSRSIAGSLDLDMTAVTAEQGVRYAGVYGRVLERLATHPDEGADRVDLFDPTEREAMITAGRARAAPAAACLHDLVGRQIARTPDAVAVTAGEQSITFAGLDRRANQLAHGLIERGIRPDSVVAVCTSSCCDRVVALLAVLRAGAAYLLLESGQPRERLAAVLADAGVQVIVADESTVGCEWPQRADVVVLPDLLAGRPSTAPAVSVLPDNLAYVIFTSGSTGRPKGAQITHRGIASHMEWMRRRYPLVSSDRVLQKTPVSFDASVWEFWAPLVECGSVVLVPDGSHRDPEFLARVMRNERISILQLVPTLLNALLDAPDLVHCVALRRLFVGGEPLARELALRAGKIRPAIEVVNLYGPAETTIDATSCTLRAEHLVAAIGKPIDGMRAFVVDDAFHQIAPVGTDGDLYLGGAGLARGYAGRPGWTAASFVPDALSGDAGARLYATGDRARWVRAAADTPDLELEFRGRADDQVKLYGQRVELGEIDAALRSHPAVQEAVTLLLDDGPRKRLVTHVVRATEVELAGELSTHLADRLPRALIPNAFVFHDALPQTAGGKIDRRALIAASGDVAEPRRPYVAPRSEIERLLVKIVAEVLGVERIGVSDDFYELGGDSILTLQIASRLRQAGWRLSPRRILEHPTVARVAAHAVPLVAGSKAASTRPAAGNVPLAPIQRDFFARLDAISEAGFESGRPAHWNQSMLLTVPAGIEAGAVCRAVDAVAAIHDATRLRFRRTPAGWEQHYVPVGIPGGIEFESVDLSTAGNWQAELASRAEQAQAGLDLEQGPVGRAVYFSRGAERGRLLLVLHHLVVDVVSWRILLEDLAAAMASGEVKLPPPSSPYSDWVAALEGRARSADAGPWLALSETQTPSLTLGRLARAGLAQARHGVRADNFVKDAGAVRVRLDETSTAALLRDAPGRLRARPEELLVAALFESLSSAEEASSLWLELEGHGREEVAEAESIGLDVSRTVGWFTALYPVCLHRSAGIRGGELLRAVKRCLRPLNARGVDFGALLHLSPDPEVRAQLAALPRREVAFNFLGRLDAGRTADAAASTIDIQPAPEPAGHEHDPAGQRHYLLEVIARVSEGELVIDWIYPGKMFSRATVELQAAEMVRGLKDIIASDAAAAAAPSDFPLVRLGEDELDTLLVAHPDAESVLPPSPLQDGLLFHALDDDQPGVYLQQITAVLDGDVDRRAFEAAWDGALRRHNALRATFHRSERDGHAFSIVHRNVRCPVKWLDWADMGPTEVDKRWRQLLREDRARGFLLDRPPLMRVQVVRVGDRAWRLLWSHHHLLLDGWSLPLVLADVMTHYRALTEGAAAPATPAGSYVDYLAWLSARNQTAAQAHWRELLRGFDTPSLMLLPPAAVLSSREAPEDTHGEVELVLPEAVTRALSALARDNHLTLSTIMQCWWAHLVARFSGRRDVVFGVTVSGRSAELPDVDTTAGLFINTLPLRVGVPAGCTLLGLAGRFELARATLTDHEDSRLVDVQRLADLPRGTQLFDSILIFQNYPLGEALAPLADFTVRDVEAIERTHYPLTCFVMPGRQLQVRLVYDATRFSREGVERVLEHGHRMLVATAESPMKPLEAVCTFPRRELELLVHAADGLERGHDRLSLHERIARVAARDPHRTAVVCGDDTLSYRELVERSNRLAWALNRHGIGAEDLVGVCLDRSADMLVALLGVLGSGAAYVPLDPRFPRPRLELMLADSAPRAVVTRRDLTAGLSAAAGPEPLLVELDDLADDLSHAAPPPVVIHPESLAYVIFTSGSTGRPKGVQVTRAALANVIDSFAARPGLNREDTFLAVTTLSFDIAALELFLPLTVGARLVVAGAEEAADAAELGELIEREHATVMQATPATWQMLVAAGWTGAPDLSVWSGGEALPADLAGDLLARGRALWNLYGPTETTIWSKAGAVGASRDAMVLGRPIAATSTYVVDSELELAPLGVSGELLIAGRGLARGYRGQPGLTAERFVPDAFGSPGARAYRTGDEVRGISGELEFLGRLDQQVKIRGFRVELGEIEQALRAMPAVANAVAMIRIDRPGHPRLVAYVVPAGRADPNLRQQMQDRLSGLLPGYMLPTAYVLLEALPLTPNGKIDRRALPVPGDASGHDRDVVAPRNEIEQAIAGIWQIALGVQQIGVTDSFFDLGGQSLIAASLLSTLHQAFKVKLPMRAFFAGPTVEQMARAILELEERPGRVQQIARALVRIRGMSPEAKALLREQRLARGGSGASRDQQVTASSEGR